VVCCIGMCIYTFFPNLLVFDIPDCFWEEFFFVALDDLALYLCGRIVSEYIVCWSG
jgi:hypothetical protein